MAATGGSARSTVAHLLADELAAAAATVVLDLAPRLASPWPTWSGAERAGGLAALLPDRPATRGQIRGAAASRRAPEGDWHVLTDGREWHAAPLPMPSQPAAWYQLAAAGGWQAAIADTVHPVAHDLLATRYSGTPSLTRAWCDLPFAVPILCAQATADGIQTLQQAVMVLHAEGLPLQRTVVVLAATADGRPPAVVKAAATMLSARAAAVVHLPHDADIRANGLQAQPARIRPRTRQAAEELATAVLTAAREAFGDPLPAAPQPAPLPAVAVPAVVVPAV
ncbi:hypothetical protein OHA37_39190 [Streptomyces sp. NBC_00335]|uniref:hypothetical protein n=1 Tax=unclassified Streptomyces TaxID=2593676 RepID=UPI002253D539|nr:MULTISPECIES: hypothetical protein [unclassified Streptomyces]MCX5409858.1 hypothetical protein [Streptomyces sp. NBC_00086]